MTRVTFTILFDKYLDVGLTWSGLCLLAKIWSIINDYTNNIFPFPILYPASWGQMLWQGPIFAAFFIYINSTGFDNRPWWWWWKVMDGHRRSWKVMKGHGRSLCWEWWWWPSGLYWQPQSNPDSGLELFVLKLDWNGSWTWKLYYGLTFFVVVLPVPPHCSQFKYPMFFFPRNKIHLEIFWTSSSNQMRQSSHII